MKFITLKQNIKSPHRPFIYSLNADAIENIQTQEGSQNVYTEVIMRSGTRYYVRETQEQILELINGPSNITRVEVIDSEGRDYIKTNVNATVSMQDDNRTLKVFIK